MKLTGIEKGIIAIIVVCVIGLAACLVSLGLSLKTVEQRGLKSVVDEVWNGTSGESR